MPDGEIYRAGYEALSMGFIMELLRDVRVATTDRNYWMKGYPCESSASVGGLGHLSLSFVLVILDDYSAYSAEVEV